MKKVIANKEPGDTVELKDVSINKIYIWKEGDDWYQAHNVDGRWIPLSLDSSFTVSGDDAESLEILLSYEIQRESITYEFDNYREMITFLYEEL